MAHTLGLEIWTSWECAMQRHTQGFWAGDTEQVGVWEALRAGGDERARCAATWGRGNIQVKSPPVAWQMEKVKEAALSSVSSSVNWLPARKKR